MAVWEVHSSRHAHRRRLSVPSSPQARSYPFAFEIRPSDTWLFSVDTLNFEFDSKRDQHRQLASALYQTGELKNAAEHFAAVATRMPGGPMRDFAGIVYARIDRAPDAMRNAGRAGDRAASFPRNGVGRICAAGQAAAALTHLRTAAEVQQATAEAHQFLGDAYKKQETPPRPPKRAAGQTSLARK